MSEFQHRVTVDIPGPVSRQPLRRHRLRGRRLAGQLHSGFSTDHSTNIRTLPFAKISGQKHCCVFCRNLDSDVAQRQGYRRQPTEIRTSSHLPSDRGRASVQGANLPAVQTICDEKTLTADSTDASAPSFTVAVVRACDPELRHDLLRFANILPDSPNGG